MTLQEVEIKLSELNNRIAELLKEREKAIKEWSIVFNTEKPEKIVCIAENPAATRDGPRFLYLVNGDSKMLVCHLYCDYKKCSIEEFYKQIDISMHLLSETNGRGFDIPELHRNLVYAKAMEIREQAGEQESR